jgi:hypothetical protein
MPIEAMNPLAQIRRMRPEDLCYLGNAITLCRKEHQLSPMLEQGILTSQKAFELLLFYLTELTNI